MLKHPAVLQAAAIGSPDELRGEIVKAFIVLADGFEASRALPEEIQNPVRTSLAAYEYPREIEFVNELPLTTTGKVRRVELRERERRRKGLTVNVEFIPGEYCETAFGPGVCRRPGAYVEGTLPGVRGPRS